MKLNTISRAGIGLTALGAALLATVQLAPGARAQELGPSIMATTDLAVYGDLYVTGQGFGSSDPVTLQVLNPTTGAVLATVSTTASAASSDSEGGTVAKSFLFNVPCGVQQVALQAVDTTTHEVSNSVPVSLGSPVSIATNQIIAAGNKLDALMASPPDPSADTSTISNYYEQITTIAAAIAGQESNLTTVAAAQAATQAACAAAGS